eukprot:scaffold8008_cov430-Prasinococcus_capsulatus_cf.AAC.6
MWRPVLERLLKPLAPVLPVVEEIVQVVEEVFDNEQRRNGTRSEGLDIGPVKFSCVRMWLEDLRLQRPTAAKTDDEPGVSSWHSPFSTFRELCDPDISSGIATASEKATA